MTWHPLVKGDQKGATAASNQAAMEVIRGLPVRVPNPLRLGEDDDEFISNSERDNKINEMIESNIPLVLKKVDVYTDLDNSICFLYDDLVSEGLIALTKVVNKLACMDTPTDGGNVTGYIGNNIVWALCDCVDRDKNQQIPAKYTLIKPDVIDPMETIDIRDLLKASCLTDEDRVIMEMREQGCKDEAIAKRLDISRRAISLMRHEMLCRYDELKQRLDT